MRIFLADCVLVFHVIIVIVLLLANPLCSCIKTLNGFRPWAQAFVAATIIIQIAFNFCCPLTILELSIRGKPLLFKSYLAFYLQKIFGWNANDLCIFIVGCVFLIGPIIMLTIRNAITKTETA